MSKPQAQRSLFKRIAFQVPCQVEIEHTDESLHAHVDLEGDIPIGPGDEVCVQGEPIEVAFGERQTFKRTASVTQVSALEQIWTKLLGRLELTELFEVSFSDRKAL